jgi:hypothetical protein
VSIRLFLVVQQPSIRFSPFVDCAAATSSRVVNVCVCVFGVLLVYDAHVTVHRDKFRIIKPTRCPNFSNLILE